MDYELNLNSYYLKELLLFESITILRLWFSLESSDSSLPFLCVMFFVDV